jgi:CO dehydrogenase maturation factor
VPAGGARDLATMKAAITGKGGVGKTTLAALLATAFAGQGRRVLALDADPNATLAACLGFPSADTIPPLSAMADLIAERTGVRPDTPGAFFKLNPRVDDIPDRFAVEHRGIRLLRMGALKKGGSGCYCAENAFVRSLVAHLLLGEQDVLLMDMEAGLEHLSRGTARGVDRLLVVVEPSRQSVETARRIRQLAGDLGLSHLGAVANKVRDARSRAELARAVAPLPLWGAVPYDSELARAELEGRPPPADRPELNEAVAAITRALVENPGASP